MADRLYCALNGTTLRDLDARIHLLDVEELAPAVRTVAARGELAPGGGRVTASRIGGGLHLLRRQREQLSLRVRFLIEEYDIAARHQLLHLVAAWAEAGGVLTLHEDGKRVLRVVCTQYPTMSTLNWLETLSLVFTAFSCPYWEDAAETSFLMPNTSDAPSKLLAVPGDAPETPLNLLIRNIGDAAITTLTISAAGKISFQGLTIAPGAAIRIHHNAGVFAAEMVSDDSTVSILPYRTPDSADDLLLRPGVLNEIRVEAGSAAFVSGRCKGRYC
ncbi:unknown [Faecalibacterium sp. CAG:74]|nr:unknown [Faecalibacterium sp. CAG:74]